MTTPLSAPASESGNPAPLSTINNFDLIRLIAATDVAVKHGMVHLEVGLSWREWLGLVPGVPIFFFVSGYLIYRSYQNAADVRKFALNRILRLYPALYVCTAVAVLSTVVAGYLPVTRMASPDFAVWLAAQLTFFQFYNWDFFRGYGVGVLNGSLWTIGVELQFYVLTPFLFAICKGKPNRLLAAIGLFAVLNILFGFMDQTTTLGKLVQVSFLPWLYMFLVGAWFSTRDAWVSWVLQRPWWQLGAAYLAGLGISLGFGLDVLGNSVNPLLFLPICALILKCAFTAPGLANRMLRKNDVSYGVYIYHMPIVNLLVFSGFMGAVVPLSVAMAATFVMAALSWFLIEKPALALKKAALRRY